MTVRRGRGWRALLCACIVGGVAAPSFGTATLINDDRFIELSADVSDFSGGETGPIAEFTPNPPGSAFSDGRQYDLITSSGGAWARSFAQQDSSLVGGTNFSSATASGLVEAEGGMDFDGLSSTAFAESRFQLDFNVATPHQYSFSGTLDERSSGTTIRAVLKEFGSSDVFRTVAEGAFSNSGIIPAGDYTVEVVARVFTSGSFYNADASFSGVALNLTEVPEPSTFALCALAGLAIRYRRRR